MTVIPMHNDAPPPNRRPRFPFAASPAFDYRFCAPPDFSAAVGEARRWTDFGNCMKRAHVIALAALVFSGCSRRDPIDALMAKIPNEDVPSYLFRPIALPRTASPEMLISNLTSRGELQNPKVLEIRQTHTKPQAGYGFPVEDFTAVLVDAGTGRKIVVFRPLHTNDWYFKVYDAQ